MFLILTEIKLVHCPGGTFETGSSSHTSFDPSFGISPNPLAEDLVGKILFGRATKSFAR
jgi:hypothetical protein